MHHVIKMINIRKVIQDQILLDGIDLTLESGRSYVICGPTGSGKTTFLRFLAGLVNPTEGELYIDDRKVDWPRRRKDILSTGMVFEHVGLCGALTAIENLRRFVATRCLLCFGEIDETLKRVGIDPDDPTPFKEFDSEKQLRLLVAQAILDRPRVLLLDDPLEGQPKSTADWLGPLLVEEVQRGALVVVTSSEVSAWVQGFHKVFQMDRGRLTPLFSLEAQM